MLSSFIGGLFLGSPDLVFCRLLLVRLPAKDKLSSQASVLRASPLTAFLAALKPRHCSPNFVPTSPKKIFL